MCGIVGYIALNPKKNSVQRKNALGTLLLADMVRGACGTGIYAADTLLGKSFEFKKALASPDFLQHRIWEAFARDNDDYQVVIGHNRAATYGSAKDENCHPFINKHIGLVHNGSVSNYYSISSNGFSHQVDSAHIADGMAEFGEKETLEKLDGPAVLVWHNSEKGTFNIARNENRDIYYIFGKNDDLYFASEYLLLDWVLDRVGIETKGKYLRPEDHHWASWDITGKEIKEPEWIKFEKRKKPEPWKSSHNRQSQWRNRDEDELIELGLQWQTDYKLKVKGFSPYTSYVNGKNTTKDEGYMICSVVDVALAEKAEVRIHGVKLSEYSEFQEAGFVRAKVGSCWHEKGKQIIVARYPTKIDALAIPIRFHGPGGKLVSREKAEELIKDNCCWCNDPIPLADFNDIKWIPHGGYDSHVPLCKNCKQDQGLIDELGEYLGTWVG